MAVAALWTLGLVSVPAVAAPEPQSHAVVQALPDPNDPSRALSAALIRLGRNPRDSEALIAAGNAALEMGDTDAAKGFLARADRLTPENPRIQAGLARAMLRGDDPVGSIPLFEAAERGGALTADELADRGLAYDLVGDNLTAQRFYRQALAMGANDETVRRLALSLAVAGDRRGMETALSPLLQKQDRASWRVRAFAFAILGREEEAVAIAKSTMPEELAIGMAPYLRYMRKLTPAQQAAAANLGKFPQASVIGQDDPQIAAYAAAHGVKRLALANVDAGLVPTGEALGTKDRKRRKSRSTSSAEASAPSDATGGGELAAAVAPPEPMPSREVQPEPVPQLAEVREKSVAAKPAVVRPAPVKPVQWVPVPVVAPPVKMAPVPPLPQQSAPVRVMGPTLAEAEQGSAVPPVARPVAMAVAPPMQVRHEPVAPVIAEPQRAPAPAPASAPAPVPRKRDFSEVFGALGKAQFDTTPASGAVDLRKITPLRPAPKAPPPPPPPAHPSRIWVQLEVGRDTGRLGFDWRKLVREDAKLFRGKKPFSTDWVRTNRLLVGPFETEAAAKAYNERLHEAGHDGTHVWISPAGQVVDALESD